MFDNIDNEESAYWLGFIAADGCIMNPKRQSLSYRLQIRLAAIDVEHLKKLATCLDVGICGPYRLKNMDSVFYTLQCSRKEVVDGLMKNGILPRKTFTVKPWNGPDSLMSHYWRGVFDGDGWISFCSKNPNRVEVGLVGNEYMIKGFSDFLFKTIGRRFGIYPNKSVWRCQTAGVRAPISIISALYDKATISIDRKRRMVEKVLALKSKQYDSSKITLCDLEKAYIRLGTWNAVAAEYNTNKTSIRNLRYRLA